MDHNTFLLINECCIVVMTLIPLEESSSLSPKTPLKLLAGLIESKQASFRAKKKVFGRKVNFLEMTRSVSRTIKEFPTKLCDIQLSDSIDQLKITEWNLLYYFYRQKGFYLDNIIISIMINDEVKFLKTDYKRMSSRRATTSKDSVIGHKNQFFVDLDFSNLEKKVRYRKFGAKKEMNGSKFVIPVRRRRSKSFYHHHPSE